MAVEAAKFLFGMCDCTVYSDVGTGDFSLVPGMWRMCGHMHMHMSPDMDCMFLNESGYHQVREFRVNQGILFSIREHQEKKKILKN